MTFAGDTSESLGEIIIVAETLESRVENFKSILAALAPLTPKNSCFIPQKRGEARVDGKNNIAYFIWVNPRVLARGSFAEVRTGCILDPAHRCFGMPIVVRVAKSTLRDGSTVHPSETETLSQYYVEMSESVLSGRIPNFPLTTIPYSCGAKDQPIIIQEKANMTLKDWIVRNYDDMDGLKKILVQCLMALRYIQNTGYLNCDVKPLNILIKDILPETIQYELSGKYYNVQTDKLAMITDWDLTINFDTESRGEVVKAVITYWDFYYGSIHPLLKHTAVRKRLQVQPRMIDSFMLLGMVMGMINKWPRTPELVKMVRAGLDSETSFTAAMCEQLIGSSDSAHEGNVYKVD
jgi:serine/threonine protein kinase